MDNKKVQFIPFQAINAFMLPDYRMNVIREVLSSLPSAPEKIQAQFSKYFKTLVQVPGFRNSSLAPLSLKIKPFISVFEKDPEVAGTSLSRWVDLHPELKQQVYDLLVARKWEILPPDADRTKLPGFLVTWPAGEDFDAINKGFQEMYPEVQVSANDVSLMAVWLAGRLPYQNEGEK
jgi:hypothetical protein